ncbi:UDP-N-acetylmuramoyl-L-alanyl-D-glutamate--2,6-diaminopimelate ligase [bacterium endosymbiont of Pedicinus badii]|uniref:UDP-N-acetylmuramoyl-L-alanyl-D-glutamate--2, 6-diaminopimelate ligase n=1 Tax=bacterium endosymbiont of Pedicinus badii TaxID=1719126 RepID=UPI0009BB1026|nr:UDP-N-acetylmuramoyl-L-alanyl-D-glutamate--2,6-diaminopimelate ligase [bacterium endosymbiont of Pedicinus badii]OQM34215.1 hypothetical protein AOQ89_02685 [bacterium endosymbiont of Pedicinus badii]
MIQKNLKELFSIWIKRNKIPSCTVENLSLDSKKKGKNSLFFAIKGSNLDGRNYIQEAISNGSIAIAIDSNCIDVPHIITINKIYFIYISKLKKKISKISEIFYDFPKKNIKIVGITGTNGKTTISNMLAKWVNLLGIKSAFFGTLGKGIVQKKIFPTKNTTESAINMQKFLYRMKKKKVKFVSIEVSSHSLQQYRVSAIKFDAVILSNISHDHFDFHKNFQNYKDSKFFLFRKIFSKNKIISIDESSGIEIAKMVKNPVVVSKKKFFLCKKYKYWITLDSSKKSSKYTKIFFSSYFGKGILKCNFLGSFNFTNLLLSFATLVKLGYSFKKLVHFSKYLLPVPGRMEKIDNKNFPSFLIDYAHNPKSLKNLLLFARNNCNKNVWCIFGCGGNRDKQKRPKMAKIAEKYSNFVIVTSDNPRNERISSIFFDIIKGFRNLKNIYFFFKRKKAIEFAFFKAEKNDLIVVSGKGNEKFQIIKNKKIYFSDKKIVENLLKKNDQI